MLAGRKLLLADDSITIQKVVALTFADEGIEVLAVNNGADAIEKLEEFGPDIVLADVYMPKMSGLQVCEYIKRSEKLRHIPVMLLVGSFEPFDEAEARRVGADDILTKPFQSIRTLVEKVGLLLGREPAPENPEAVSPPAAPEIPEASAPTPEPAVPETVSASVESAPLAVPQIVAELDGATTLEGAETLEFPDPVVSHVAAAQMDSGELELTTADTKPLSPEIRAHVQPPANEERAMGTVVEQEKMATHFAGDARPEPSEGFGDMLLDLGDFEAAPLLVSDDVILDIDFDSPTAEPLYATPPGSWQSAVAVEAPAAPPAVVGGNVAWSGQAEEAVDWEGEIHTSNQEWITPTPAMNVEGAAATVQDFREPEHLEHSEVVHPPATAVAAPFTGQITLAQLSPEVIDAIARRAVELLSEKAVQEIAWEVVPQLAELLIRRKLEENK